MGSASSSRQSSNSTQSSSVWDEQSPFLQDLYNRATGVLDSQGNQPFNAANQYAQLAQPAYGQAIGAAGNLAGGTGQAGQTFGQLAQGTSQGQQFMQDRLGQNNPYLEGLIGQSVNDIQQGLQQNIIPSITSNAINLGAFGGSREAITRGIAGQAAIEQMGDVSQQLRYGDYLQQGQNASALSQSQLQGAQGLAASQAAGLSALPGVTQGAASSAQSPFTAQWSPIAAAGQAFGNPTVLGEGSSSSKGRSKGLGIG